MPPGSSSSSGVSSSEEACGTLCRLQSVTNENFGPLIAYLIPGATVLLGASEFSPALRAWLAVTAADAPTIGGFLYLTLASLGAGMTVSAIRWLVIDSLHAWTGIRPPALDFGKLGKNVEAFAILIDIHYRHYQFHANMVVAVAAAYLCHRLELGVAGPVGWFDFGALVIVAVFFVTSRDNLRKYYVRSKQLLSA